MSTTSVIPDPDKPSEEPPSHIRDEIWRGNLYKILAKGYSSPLVMTRDDPESLMQLIADLPPSLQDRARTLAGAWDDSLNDLEKLSLAYARLFLGPFEILASPYASFYLEPNQRLMGEVSRWVAEAYVEVGLGPGAGPHEAPDHIALEMEYMYYLTYQYVTTGQEHWLTKRISFHTNHVILWMPKLTEAIVGTTESAFYDNLALLTLDILKK